MVFESYGVHDNGREEKANAFPISSWQHAKAGLALRDIGNNFYLFVLYTPMPQTNTRTVLKYETLANIFSAEFFPCFI